MSKNRKLLETDQPIATAGQNAAADALLPLKPSVDWQLTVSAAFGRTADLACPQPRTRRNEVTARRGIGL